ncbi:hypothetical protein MAR_034996, partial [Mya arenaria]
MAYGRTGSVRECPTAASPTPTPPGSRAFPEFSISLMSQWLYSRTAGLVRKCPTAASPTPTPPGSRAYQEFSISLMSQWLYGRTAGSV